MSLSDYPLSFLLMVAADIKKLRSESEFNTKKENNQDDSDRKRIVEEKNLPIEIKENQLLKS